MIGEPPLFEVCETDVALQALLGDSNTLRIFAFGNAPQKSTRPYVVWRTVYGSPENYLGSVPDIDYLGTEINVYAPEAQDARDIKNALVLVIEQVAHVTGWNGEGLDTVTGLYLVSFTVDWFVNR